MLKYDSLIKFQNDSQFVKIKCKNVDGARFLAFSIVKLGDRVRSTQ